MKVPQLVWNLIHHGISSVTGMDYPCSTISTTPFGNMLTQALTIQLSIRWTFVLKRRSACAWGDASAYFYNIYHAEEVNLNRDCFQKGLIRQLCKMYKALWISRSKQLHDSTHLTALATIELDTGIQHFYSQNALRCFGSCSIVFNGRGKRCWSPIPQ